MVGVRRPSRVGSIPTPTSNQFSDEEGSIAMRVIGFTGTRKGMTARQKEELRNLLLPSDQFHHGDCLGADTEAHAIAREIGCSSIVIHPSDLVDQRAFCNGDIVRRVKAPLTRNRIIVYNATFLIAAPATSHEVLRSGTWATIRYARDAGKHMRILEP